MNALDLGNGLAIPLDEIELTAVRAGGPGGQNVNKVATAIQLRFNIHQSSLPEPIKQRLLDSNDQRITNDGEVVMKANEHRTQERNRQAALARLGELISAVREPPRPRRKTRPSRAAKRRRLEHKKQRAQIKAARRKPTV